jgi:hypothetical protein
MAPKMEASSSPAFDPLKNYVSIARHNISSMLVHCGSEGNVSVLGISIEVR